MKRDKVESESTFSKRRDDDSQGSGSSLRL